LDDFIFEINGKLAKEYLSEGEVKNAILAFKISEIKYCIKVKNRVPILILDDLFSELDNKKINSLISNFKKSFQIIITTTDIDKINKKLLNNCRVFKITNKRIEVKNYE
jgi:DNA replication and repair protein RecF